MSWEEAYEREWNKNLQLSQKLRDIQKERESSEENHRRELINRIGYVICDVNETIRYTGEAVERVETILARGDFYFTEEIKGIEANILTKLREYQDGVNNLLNAQMIKIKDRTE